MAAPSKSWTDILNSKIDADSPVLEELMTWIRDNIEHGDERIGIPTTSAARQANHEHLGLDKDGSALLNLGTKIKFKDEPVSLDTPGTSFSDLDVSEHVVPNLSEIEMQWFDDSVSTLNDITAKLQHSDVDFQSGLLEEAADYLYIGANVVFGKVIVDMISIRTGQGALIAEYFDGVSFSAQPSVVDGTESGGNTLAQDGAITFPPQSDWAVGADSVQAGLDSSLFFMRFKQTNAPSGDQRIDQAVAKIDTASLAIILMVSSGGDGVEWRKDGVTNTQVKADNTDTVWVPLASEIVEHKRDSSTSVSEYKLAGYII